MVLDRIEAFEAKLRDLEARLKKLEYYWPQDAQRADPNVPGVLSEQSASTGAAKLSASTY